MNNTSICFLDTEFNATDYATQNDGIQEITEIGAVIFKNGKLIDRFSCYCKLKKGHRLTKRCKKITGITPEILKNNGIPFIQAMEKLDLFLKKILEEQGIVIEQIAALASIDVKKEERCLLEFSEKYRIPFRTYTAQELQAVPGEFHGSEFVKAQVGVDNVCERAALKAAGTGGWILLSKQAQDGMTVAVAEKTWKERIRMWL